MIHVRWMIRRDVPEVLRMSLIEEVEILRKLRENNHIGMVATEGYEGPVVGWMIYLLEQGSLQLLDLDTHEWSVQEALVNRRLEKMGPEKTRTLLKVSVPLDGEEASWWKQKGFQLASFDSQENVLCMEFHATAESVAV